MKFNLNGENELNVCPKSGEMLTMHKIYFSLKILNKRYIFYLRQSSCLAWLFGFDHGGLECLCRHAGSGLGGE